MPRVEGGIVIHRPVDEVFTYATSAESHLQWVPGIRRAAYLEEVPSMSVAGGERSSASAGSPSTASWN